MQKYFLFILIMLSFIENSFAALPINNFSSVVNEKEIKPIPPKYYNDIKKPKRPKNNADRALIFTLIGLYVYPLTFLGMYYAGVSINLKESNSWKAVLCLGIACTLLLVFVLALFFSLS